MKKALLIAGLILSVSQVFALDHSIINREDLSLKAGPTEPGEEVSLVWLECYVYPKSVKEEKVISLGARTTAKVKSVATAFDFGRDKMALTSNDGLYWSGAYKIPDSVPAGLHVARFEIKGSQGSLRRTVEFFVEEVLDVAGNAEKPVAQGEAINNQSWPLTVTATCAALTDGSTRLLYAGEKLVGIAKMPWYKVAFSDGREGWVAANQVKEPLEEYYQLAFAAFRDKKYDAAIELYKSTISMKPDFIKGYFWLAKSYQAKGDLDAAYNTLIEALRLDERNLDCRVLSNNLARRYFETARQKFNDKRYNEAVAAYQKVVELKPTSTLSWIELGQSYDALNLPLEARTAWREALRVEPDNKEIRALLNLEPAAVTAIIKEEKKDRRTVKIADRAAAKTVSDVPAALADDSLAIVRDGKTKRGTKITNALRSVIALTKSLGTPVVEKGWQAEKRGDQFLVRYVCEQAGGVREAFEWLVNIDTKQVQANNANSKLLLERW
ncbi:tetratricopeptide repeat protein [Candidatus Saganbacteria bacterium]|nr:tetratricopeptide repeat protein [Candidatus Saganbacteria bacterium]